MRFAENFVFCVCLLASACCLQGHRVGAAPAAKADTVSLQNWQARVQSSADDTKKARKVILDAIYANQTLPVALAYEAMYDRKPSSQIRLANFAHSAAIAEVFSRQRMEPLGQMYGRAIRALKKAVVPEQEVYPTEQAKAALNKTKVPDAWLAWGIYLTRYTMDHQLAGAAYDRALELDPTFAEADYWKADSVTSPFNQNYFDAHKDEALRELQTAELLEPKLRPLDTYTRAYIALGAMQDKKALPYLKEALRLWPSPPDPAVITRLISQLEGMKPH